MVSFQAPLLPTQRETKIRDDYELDINLTKKRKREEPLVERFFGKIMLDKEINLETPSPSEWKQCLHIKSGERDCMKTKTQMRTTKNTRTSPEPPTNHMSLDLELNLPCGSFSRNLTKNKTNFPTSGSNHFAKDISFSNTCSEIMGAISQELTLFPSQSELFEDDKREMITAACKKCYMLVMMCKSSPSCPNGKFMHPLDQKGPAFFNQKL